MVAMSAFGITLALLGALGFLLSLSSMARAVGIARPDDRKPAARRSASDAESTEAALDALAD